MLLRPPVYSLLTHPAPFATTHPDVASHTPDLHLAAATHHHNHYSYSYFSIDVYLFDK
ncbi:hypothetical protein I7I48_06947 [Histoplasma ohiense]|nr:hypothetical protein I7I48_06947 [Histoplasma ohiense (nom. inval.)]